MIKIIISDKKYLFPSKQSEITIKMGLEIEKLKTEYACDCNPEFQKWFMSILSGADYDTINLVTDEQIALIVGTHPYFAEDIRVGYNQYVKVNGKIFSLKLTDKTVREYAENDLLSSSEESHLELFTALYHQEKLPKLKSLLLRLFLKNYKSWDSLNYFSYKVVLYHYFKWKQDKLKEYNLSYDNDNIPDDQKDDTPIQLKPTEKYGIYHVLLSLVDYDYDKFEKWLDRDVLELFKYISYMRQVRIEENQNQAIK